MDGKTRKSILQRWVGSWVELHYAASSAEITLHGEMVIGPAEIRIGTHRLEAIEDKGIEVSTLNPDGRSTIFVPWHPVLLIRRPSREDLDREQSEQTEAAALARGQELMDQMANANTPTEVATARATADTWLADNPSDGDVRAPRTGRSAATPVSG